VLQPEEQWSIEKEPYNDPDLAAEMKSHSIYQALEPLPTNNRKTKPYNYFVHVGDAAEEKRGGPEGVEKTLTYCSSLREERGR
jgi:hypothetical protein